MKLLIHITVALLLCLGFGSCKKNYACRCTTTITYSSRNNSYSSKTVTISEKLSKTQAQAVCQHESENINATYYNIDTNGGQWVSGTGFHTFCKLE